MGDTPARRVDEIAALRRGIELGMTLIDTAEMYGDGRSEELVGEAIKGRRDAVFLVSKVLPSHASKRGTIRACERSLQRLHTDRLDLYMLHWRGRHGLHETVAGFEELRQAGKIRHWGVSNLDADEMEELMRIPYGSACATNQVLYNLARRGIEHDLQPWMCDHAMPVMAYSPILQGQLADEPALASVAARHNATPAQVALAWLAHQPGVISIPKAGSAAHVEANHAALDLRLAPDDLTELDRAFPPPARKQPLEMI